MSKDTPLSSTALPGSVLAYLIDATITVQWGGASTFATWEDEGIFTGSGPAVYATNDGQGLYGAIIFEGKSLVGLFYDSGSERTPHRYPDAYDLNRFFQGMSPHHRSLAGRLLRACAKTGSDPLNSKGSDPFFAQALKYFVEHVGDKHIPAVTAAFWDEGEHLAAAEPWQAVVDHGVRLVRKELMADIEEALAAWQEEYELTDEQVAFVRFLFNRKMSHPNEPIQLTQDDVEWLKSVSENVSAEGIAACREKLAAIGIQMPSPS